MASVNKVILIGNLGKDPELRYLPDGRAVVNFSIATSERWKDKSGAPQERTEWHNIVAYARLAEICSEFLGKGKQVYIEGRIQTRTWEKEGVKQYKTEIVAREMTMLGRKEGDGSGAGGGGARKGGPASNANAPAEAEGADPDYSDDDIPF